jgi:DNA-binding response OmpR family regulator
MSEKISVLVVEDEEHILTVLDYNLKMDGFEVYLAADGPSGLELARRENPDVILLDWMMPEMDGLKVLSELKYDSKTKDIPVFMLTAKGMMDDVGKALYEGADDYITKPFDPVELGEIIRQKLAKCADMKSRQEDAAIVFCRKEADLFWGRRDIFLA